MTQYSFPWNDVNGDRLYDAEDFMRFFAVFLKTGVVMSFKEGLRVRSAQNGMNIQVGGGSAVIGGGSYLNDENIAIQVNVASSVQNRTDSVVLRMDKNARDTYLYYKPSDTTVVRNDILFELQLATISVKMNATQITDADITDMRSNPTVCGWSTPFDNINVDGIVDQYKGIFAQADVEFQAWFQNLKNQLDDNQAANIQNQIDAINGVIVQKDIPDGANLDDYKTEGEFSKKTPTVVEGAPEGVTGAFRLSVRTMLGSSGVFQTLYDYATRSMYYRIGNTTLGFNLPWQKVVTDVEDVPWTDLTPGTGVLVPSDATLKYRIKSGYITIVASNVQTTIDSNGQKLLTALPLSLFSKFTFVGTIFTGNATNVWRVGISGYNLYVAGTAGVRSNYVSFSVTLPIN
ncbi:pyocin knob domain-containing protein [Lactococcus petauri]|uniref:pyocin knob domain-containing protein n=1 Tax=Lactococcus TaxID=1357 RepID=UPI000621C250|nr:MULTISPECIES: pyocin knob domain-containing protein [Lactococcus]KKF91535.1 phage baseplate protein [Lactococcus garvieae]MCH1714048.1 pyocin knob domain-containing protein [Lactococcus petauri]MDG6136992.1 pyocin knob domain-containing protein [Lactococcus petauri]MDT2553048.1 pyocin knob domain-containing protein [Lactococcus petauri]MDT2563557.1 pyocin knob domain-containing protein [Lactococcus petauri]